ncbi:MAG: type IV secretion system DNA-binding domain-containing protein [Pseudomonadales bacterium]|nr:type IV secretion system DNA-binding domain-containing protein [Pseudomonadales bacterium]
MTSSAFTSGYYTQGGQTHLHRLRMLNQVLGATIKGSFVVALCYIAMRVYFDWQPYWNLACFWKLKLHIFMHLPEGYFNTCNLITSYDDGYGSPVYTVMNHQQMLNNPVYLSHVDKVIGMAWSRLFESIGIFTLSVISISLVWSRVGRQKKKTKIVKGTRLVTPKDLSKQIKKAKQASDLQLGGSRTSASVPLIKGKETQHMLIAGTTGAGKTNAINELLMQIRERGDRAIIVDSNGEFLQKFYQESDLIFNPLDKRSVNWNLWQECPKDRHINDFAECLIPQEGNDPFWGKTSRLLFSETAKKLRGTPSYSKFMDMALKKPLSKVESFYRDTLVAALMSPEAERTAASVRTSLTYACQGFALLQDCSEEGHYQPSWSIRKWMAQNSNEWLFLSCEVDQRALLKSLFAGMMGCASRALMNTPVADQQGDNEVLRTWFIIDELPSLDAIPDLPKAMAEVRKYNGCFVLGLQNISQLENIYGHHNTKTINSLTSTKLIFRLSDHETARHMSSFLGRQEVLEPSESISFGAHQMRDGVSLGSQRRTKTTVDETDIMALGDLQCYLTLPGNYPLTKLKFKYHKLECHTPACIEKDDTATSILPDKTLPTNLLSTSLPDGEKDKDSTLNIVPLSKELVQGKEQELQEKNSLTKAEIKQELRSLTKEIKSLEKGIESDRGSKKVEKKTIKAKGSNPPTPDETFFDEGSEVTNDENTNEESINDDAIFDKRQQLVSTTPLTQQQLEFQNKVSSKG